MTGVGIKQKKKMRFFKRLLTGHVLYFVNQTKIQPCKCAVHDSIDAELESATAVFIGKVTDIQEANIYFMVEKVFKGKHAQRFRVHRSDTEKKSEISQRVWAV